MDEKLFFMRETIKIAKEALTKDELPIAALIVHENEILASGYTHEQTEKRKLVHAELLVLEKIDKNRPSLKKRQEMKLYTTLEPCMMCLGASMTFGIGEIVYSVPSKIDGATKLLRNYNLPHEYFDFFIPTISGGILQEQTKHLFEKYLTLHKSGLIKEWVKGLLNTF